LIAHAIMNIVLDVVVIGIPMPILFRLHMSREKKVGMCVMFAVGIVYVSDPFFSVQEWRIMCYSYRSGSGSTNRRSVTVVSIFRLVEAVGFNSTMNPTSKSLSLSVSTNPPKLRISPYDCFTLSSVGSTRTNHQTEDFVPVGMWSLLEIDIGIMCACMPGIRALCKRLYALFFPKPLGYETYEQRSKQSKHSGSGSGSKQYSSSKSSTGALESGNGGQFIRLEEVSLERERARDRGSEEDCWPLRDTPPHTRSHSHARNHIHTHTQGSFQGPPMTRQESTGRRSMGRDRESLGITQGWHTQYPTSPSPTRLKPPPLTPTRDTAGSGYGRFGGKKSRANSMHFTWFRDGDSSS
jgi:hypothetical protein